MGPRKRREDKIDLIETSQETLMPTDSVETREHDQDDFYETPVDIEGYYHEKILLDH